MPSYFLCFGVPYIYVYSLKVKWTCKQNLSMYKNLIILSVIKEWAEKNIDIFAGSGKSFDMKDKQEDKQVEKLTKEEIII